MKHWRFIPLFVLALSSCDNYLTVDPDNRTVAEGYYNSAQRIEQAVVGGYVDLRRALVSKHAWLMYGEARSGDLSVVADFAPYVASQDLVADNFDLKDLSDWGYFYDVVKSANEVLELLETTTDDVLTDYQRDLFRGEALALKSMAYFYLNRIWGEIPSAEKSDFGSRWSGNTAAEKAAGFAREAVELLPWLLLNDDGIESASLTASRFNKTAATLLLAQEELWRGESEAAYSALSLLFTDTATDRLSDFSLSMGEDRRTVISQTPLNANSVSMPIARLNSIYPADDQRRSRLFTINQTRGTLIVRDQTLLPLLKIDELNLLMSEAAWRSGRKDEGREWLVKAANGAVEDYSEIADADFEAALLRERQRMLVGTGQHFFDLMRFGQVAAYVPALSAEDVSNGAAYWPLSPQSISGNSWSQNSFWSR